MVSLSHRVAKMNEEKNCRWIWLNGNQNKNMTKKTDEKSQDQSILQWQKWERPTWTGQMPLKIMMNPMWVFFYSFSLSIPISFCLLAFFCLFDAFIRNRNATCPIGIAWLGSLLPFTLIFQIARKITFFFCRSYPVCLSSASIHHSVLILSWLFQCFIIWIAKSIFSLMICACETFETQHDKK